MCVFVCVCVCVCVCVSWFVLHWHFALVLVVMLVLGIIFFVFTFSGFGFWYFDVEFLLTFLRSRVVLALRCSALSCCLFGGWLSFFFLSGIFVMG